MTNRLTSTDQLSVGQVAERSGVSVSALHFYEREGLIFSSRNAGNQRRFNRDVLRRLAFIRASQRVGIPLGLIKEVLDELPLKRTPKEPDWAKVAKRWHEVLTEQINYMERVRDDLWTCIGCGVFRLIAVLSSTRTTQWQRKVQARDGFFRVLPDQIVDR